MAFVKLHHSIQINAPVEKVWDTTFNEDTYREWTQPFSPDPSATSMVKGDWSEGSKMLFIGTDEKGNEGGMVSKIAESKKYEFLSIEHQGILKGKEEDTTSPEALEWKGGHENYTFKKTDSGTEFIVDVDVTPEFKDYMDEAWKKALPKLKELSEKN